MALALWAALAMAASGEAAGKAPGTVMVRDVLTLPNHPVRIEAQVALKTPAAGPTVAGVLLHVRIDGKEVAAGRTNEAGQASFEYLPKMRGTNVISVAVDAEASIEAETSHATLCVWERRRPILVVELAALLQPAESSGTPAALPERASPNEPLPRPIAEAAEELSRLTQYYYNVVYVSVGQGGVEQFSIGQARPWLETHKFPAGFVAPPVPGGLSATLDSLRNDGWTTMKSGIGRTRAFADLLLQHRMEVVVVPELPKGELPRKAKSAKDWTEVRKKL
ncbi:MAG: hypothetical protein IT368_14210 [Candidatus Hydrogenedentes bacterium]|nr:hypothetical protein [Candidatus Hydrogenedentota bacterium]